MSTDATPNSQSYELRPATSADREAICNLVQQLHPDGAHLATLPLVRQESQTFIATDRGAVIGVVVATFVDYGIEAYGMIEDLIVDENRRGERIGRSLLHQCQDWCSRLGADVVFVSALPDAEPFYLSGGFTRCTGPWLYSTAGVS